MAPGLNRTINPVKTQDQPGERVRPPFAARSSLLQLDLDFNARRQIQLGQSVYRLGAGLKDVD